MSSKRLFIPRVFVSFLLAFSARAEEKVVIEGTVLDSREQAVEGAMVTAYDGDKPLQSRKTPQDGGFHLELADYTKRRVRCEIVAANFKPYIANVRVATASSQISLGKIKLQPDVVIEDISTFVSDVYYFDVFVKNNTASPKDVAEVSFVLLLENEPKCYDPVPIVSYDIGDWRDFDVWLQDGDGATTEVVQGEKRWKDKGRAEYGFDYKQCDKSTLSMGVEFRFSLPAHAQKKVRLKIPRTFSLMSNDGKSYQFSARDKKAAKEALLTNTSMQAMLHFSDGSAATSQAYPLKDPRWYALKEIKK